MRLILHSVFQIDLNFLNVKYKKDQVITVPMTKIATATHGLLKKYSIESNFINPEESSEARASESENMISFVSVVNFVSSIFPKYLSAAILFFKVRRVFCVYRFI
jgi:hypothetical protein